MRSKFATKRSGVCLDAAENERIPLNKQSACHPERSRTFSERRARKKQGAKAPQGSRNEFWWLSAVDVTSLWQATEISNEIPLRPKGLALPLVRRGSTRGSSTSVGGRTRRPALRMTYSGVVLQYVLEKSLYAKKTLVGAIRELTPLACELQKRQS